MVLLQNILLCISHVPCRECSSSFLAYPHHQIAASLFFLLRPPKAFNSPTRSVLSQLNVELLDAVSILLFIYGLICLHLGSVHQDVSGLKHNPPLLTPCYIFMCANISVRNSHVARHVLFSHDHSCSPVTLALYGLLHLHPAYVCYFTVYDRWFFVFCFPPWWSFAFCCNPIAFSAY